MEIRQLEVFEDAPIIPFQETPIIPIRPEILEFKRLIDECKAIAKAYWHSKKSTSTKV